MNDPQRHSPDASEMQVSDATHFVHACSPEGHIGSVLAVDNSVYTYVGAAGGGWTIVDDVYHVDSDKHGSKLIYSPDQGRSWRNQNGSAPVVWEPAEDQSNKTMVFWTEPQGAFEGLQFLQMGKNYGGNEDGYVYLYGSNGKAGERGANELAMFRVPKTQVLKRQAYEYFAGLKRGDAQWVKDIVARTPVHSFPDDDWSCNCVVYNAPLGVYMMIGSSAPGLVSGSIYELYKPKNVMGLWSAPKPWGPWTQFFATDPWIPGGDHNARIFSLTIAPKWIAEDGKSFWIVWSDLQHTSDFRPELLKEWLYTPSDEEAGRLSVEYRRYHPHYRFNTQRVDLVVA